MQWQAILMSQCNGAKLSRCIVRWDVRFARMWKSQPKIVSRSLCGDVIHDAVNENGQETIEE
jgi:hypothetical protein